MPDAAKAVPDQLYPELENQILPVSAEDMGTIPDNSLHLMITSPPYNARKEYDEDIS